MEHPQSAGEPTTARADGGPLQIAAAALLAVFAVGLVMALFALGLTEKNVGSRDYVEYWASGRLLLTGANPYDPAGILGLERAAGSTLTTPEVTFSPPPILSMCLLFAHFSAKNGLILMFALMLASLALSIRIILKLYGRATTLLYLLMLGPALACLQAGQISLFFLLGLCLFFYWHERFPILAGAALLPLALKPHLFMPFAIALILWIVWEKKYGVVAGFLAAVGISCAVPFYMDRNLWQQYTQMIHSATLLDQFVPSLGCVLRMWIHPTAAWLQFLPEAAACVWAAWYFWTRRERWDWMGHGQLVLVVSLLCRPYGWFFDEVVLLPALMVGIFRAKESGRSLIPFAVVGAAALVQLILLPKVPSPLYLWTAPAWLACYLYANGNNAHENGARREAQT